MSIESLGNVLRELCIDVGQVTADTRLRADLGLDSVETTELELELDRRFGLKIDLWDTTDYSLAELAARVEGPQPADLPVDEHRVPLEIPRVPPDRARRYREAGWWRAQPLDTLLLRHGHRDPGKCALVAGDRRLSYGQLLTMVDRVARRLRTLGIGRGDTVVVQLPNSIEFVILVLALIRIGAPPMLTPSTLREYELDRILGLTSPVAIAVPGRTRRSDHLSMIQQMRSRHPYLTRLLVADGAGEEGADVTFLAELCEPGQDPVFPRAEVEHGCEDAADPTDVALFLLSSGTTGPPKVMARTHEDYGYIVRSTSDVAAVDADTVYLAVMPATHTFVLAYPGIMGTLAAGGTVILGGVEDPRRVLELISRERVTHAAAVPGLVTQWVDVLRTEHYDVSSLAVLQVGGARLDAVAAERAKTALSCVVQQVYGMSEGLANFTRLDDPDAVTFESQGRPASPGDEIMIVDEDEKPVPAGDVGQLLTRGPSTVAGYYRDTAATGRAFTQGGFYRTGDLVRLRPDGNLEIAGRIKNLINRGGEKISAEELEELTGELPQVAAAGAAPMPHPMYGEAVCLFVVATGEARPELHDIRRYLQMRGLARYKLPERLELIDTMPLIGVGKLDRSALRERAVTLAQADSASSARAGR
ncbi:AMP-binding protein [Frankia sp. Cr1]|uniref:AMP-binding protein n=1 Tax=Frankia sp. Cr1 TaxID=3073931 RepID=UPI002AD41641|nr:AMP-binding protein [Frankia sp. Cr1]